MSLVTKTSKQLPKLDEQDIIERWEKAPEVDIQEPVTDDAKMWDNIKIDDFVRGKTVVNLRLNWEVVEFFRNQAEENNSKYQSDINDVLTAYVRAKTRGVVNHHLN